MVLNKELLKGAIDIHIHSAPSFFERSVDDFQLAEQIVANNMAGAVIKCHEGSSVFRATLAQKHINDKAAIMGSLVLNVYCGGLNPYAVDAFAKLGAKIIFMPTVSAANHIKFYGGSQYNAQKSQRSLRAPREGLKITDENGKILDCVIDIIDIIAEEDVCLATGHLSNEEGILLCKEAKRRGVKKIIFTHADFETNQLPIEDQKELAKLEVFIEKTMLCLLPDWGNVPAEQLAFSIKEVVAQQCILSTDYGQPTNPAPYQGLLDFIEKMLEHNISEKEIRQMICTNPKLILGL